MKSIEIRFVSSAIGILLLIVLSLALLERFTSGSRADDELAVVEEDESSTNAEKVDSVADRMKSLYASKAKSRAAIADDPDAYWDPERSDPAYRDRVIRHNQISQYLTSSRKDDPAYREVMVTLLENGYGLSDWIDFVGAAVQYHMPKAMARAAIESRGLLPDQAEEMMIPALAHQDTIRAGIYDHCRVVLGITDRALVDELLEIELPYAPGDQVLGMGPVPMLVGDRLKTDADWLDDELLAAQQRYTGKPRPSRDISSPVNWEQLPNEGPLPVTRFERDP